MRSAATTPRYRPDAQTVLRDDMTWNDFLEHDNLTAYLKQLQEDCKDPYLYCPEISEADLDELKAMALECWSDEVLKGRRIESTLAKWLIANNTMPAWRPFLFRTAFPEGIHSAAA